MVLALAMVPILVIPLVVDLQPPRDRAFLAIDYAIWAVFAVAYATKLYLAPNRGRFARRNIPDLIIVVAPMLRPMRVVQSARLLRLLQLGRVVAFAVEGLSQVRSLLARRGINYVLLIVPLVILVGAAVVREFERGVPGANILTFADALWWAFSTIATVGYGDKAPVSPAGRGVAVALMVTGIALFGVITASIAAYFLEQDDSGRAGVNEQLEEIRTQLEAISRRLDTTTAPADEG